MPITRAALHTHPEPSASATAGAGLQTPRRAAYLQSAAAVCIFAGDRVRLGDEHPVAGPSDATKKVDPLSAWYREKVCLLKEHRHWPLQNQARGSRLGSL